MRHRISQHHTCRLSFISLSSLHSSDVLVKYWQMLLPRSTCRRGEYCRQSHRGEYKRYFDWFICRGSTRWLLSPIVECEGRCLYSQCYHSIINDHSWGRQEAGGAQNVQLTADSRRGLLCGAHVYKPPLKIMVLMQNFKESKFETWVCYSPFSCFNLFAYFYHLNISNFRKQQ